MPGDVLSMEGLGGARSTARTCILRWVAPLESKRTSPARAAKQRVLARPALLCLARMREAGVGRTCRLVTRLVSIGFTKDLVGDVRQLKLIAASAIYATAFIWCFELPTVFDVRPVEDLAFVFSNHKDDFPW